MHLVLWPVPCAAWLLALVATQHGYLLRFVWVANVRWAKELRLVVAAVGRAAVAVGDVVDLDARMLGVVVSEALAGTAVVAQQGDVAAVVATCGIRRCRIVLVVSVVRPQVGTRVVRVSVAVHGGWLRDSAPVPPACSVGLVVETVRLAQKA